MAPVVLQFKDQLGAVRDPFLFQQVALLQALLLDEALEVVGVEWQRLLVEDTLGDEASVQEA